MSSVHQTFEGSKPDPARWADFDRQWNTAKTALRSDDNARRWDAVAQLAPGLELSPIMRATEAPRKLMEVARLLDEQEEAEREWWPDDAGEPECATDPAPYRPSLDEQLCVALGLTYDLPGLIAAWADRLRLDQAPAYLVRMTRDLADTARNLQATTFEELDARRQVLEDDRESRLYDQGFEDARRNPFFDPPFVV